MLLKKQILFISGFIVMLIAIPAVFAGMSSSSFKIPVSSLSGGGNVPTVTNVGSFILGTSQGQSTPIGSSSSASFGNGAGFWY